MKNIKQYINESHPTKWLSDFQMEKITYNKKKHYYKKPNKYFTEEEKGKILKDMWDKNGQFYKFIKDKVDSLKAADINDYLDQCLDDDRCAAEFAEYIAMVIGRHNFDLKQVQKFMSTEDLKG